MIYTDQPHFSHPQHNLQLEKSETPYTCDGCKEIGFGIRYRCDACNYDLHEDCMFPDSSSISHPFYKGYSFEFMEGAPGERQRYCDACGRDIKGFVYHCPEGGYDLHPCCRRLPNVIRGEGVTLKLRDKVKSRCYKCGRRELWGRVTGWSYVSTCTKYHFHVSCVKDVLLETWKRGYLSHLSSRQGTCHDDQVLEKNDGALVVCSRNQLEQQLAIPANSTTNGATIRRYWRIAKVVFKIILTSILGDPTAAILGLIEYMAS
ncbi:PREDICTED: uncharacterized protein LOC104594968 [Nelumbo nucifera]|uniref:Uncharacterized protein LOC104594968 n=2 Tax=Nelumbo nucifera TaxID=4432 RepID=A0A1U7ZXG5_NELNU|nr:PREDICTED: uncharacterized protein LOC104594968 [Nelumbo nucifera]DAD25855.1 TPA_asm: hypothetical protein HUJ06_027323 [Nelumbo nucifera]